MDTLLLDKVGPGDKSVLISLFLSYSIAANYPQKILWPFITDMLYSPFLGLCLIA